MSNIREFIGNISQQTLIVSYGNYGFIEMIKNWIYHLNKLKLLHKVVFFTMDHKIEKYFNKHLTHIKHIRWKSDNYPTITKKQEFDTPKFKQIVFQKLEIIDALLNLNKNVFFCDVDVILLKNPFKFIKINYPSHSLLFQFDCGKPCTGLFLAKPTLHNKRLFSTNVRVRNKRIKRIYERSLEDQFYINRLLKKVMKIEYTNLPSDIFLSGDDFKKVTNNNIVLNNIVSIHFNYILGYKRKIKWMKKANLWFDYKLNI